MFPTIYAIAQHAFISPKQLNASLAKKEAFAVVSNHELHKVSRHI
jgi:hypothetical protein